MKAIGKTSIWVATAIIFAGLPACKTSEANYREAYEKTIAARDAEASLDSTIYGTQRRQMTSANIETADGNVEVRRQMVKVTSDGGGLPENLKKYNVVVGQFKQLFNAKSLRNRLADGGYPSAFVVETAEPYYYIVLASFSDAAEAAKAMEEFKANGAFPMKEPCPFILDATGRRQPKASAR